MKRFYVIPSTVSLFSTIPIITIHLFLFSRSFIQFHPGQLLSLIFFLSLHFPKGNLLALTHPEILLLIVNPVVWTFQFFFTYYKYIRPCSKSKSRHNLSSQYLCIQFFVVIACIHIILLDSFTRILISYAKVAPPLQQNY